MPETRPLALYGPCSDADLAALKQAKATLDLPYLIVPTQALPGGPTRVLALRVAPKFVCDFALVADPTNPAAVLAAMSWALTPDLVDDRATSKLEWLQGLLGTEVVEVLV